MWFHQTRRRNRLRTNRALLLLAAHPDSYARLNCGSRDKRLPERGASGSVQRGPANPARPGREQRYREHLGCRRSPEVPRMIAMTAQRPFKARTPAKAAVTPPAGKNENNQLCPDEKTRGGLGFAIFPTPQTLRAKRLRATAGLRGFGRLQ